MKDAKMPFVRSIFPRVAAALFVLLLIGSLAVGCVGGIAVVEPMLIHGENVEHVDGRIVSIGPGMDFVLETVTGQRIFFQCSQECYASLGHLRRHMSEHALTDVYYVEGSNKDLQALDVD